MNKTLTVLLIEDSPDYAALVQQWLSLRTDTAFVLHRTDTLQAGLNRLKQGGVDVILLDLGLPDSSGVETFTRTKAQAGLVPVILLSGDSSEELALQLVRAGAQDYIVKGSCNGESLAKAIQYAVVRNAGRELEGASPPPNADQVRVIAVMGVKGGVGSTTIACNVGVELRLQTGQKTLVADLDLDCGMAGFLLGAESESTILDAAAQAAVGGIWAAFVARGAGDLDVLRSPNVPGLAEPDAESLRQLFAAARKQYRWLVIDLGRPAGFSLGLLDLVTELWLVTSTSVPALYQAKRSLEGLRKAGFAGDRLKLIVNQLSSAEEIGGRELDRLLGVSAYAKFSAAGHELQDACAQKRLPAKNSHFRTQMAELARKIAGIN